MIAPALQFNLCLEADMVSICVRTLGPKLCASVSHHIPIPHIFLFSRQTKKVGAKKGSSGKQKQLKFTIDLWQPLEDKVIDPEAFKKYLSDKIKVTSLGGKAGQLGDKVSIVKDNKGKLTILAEPPFSKRYLKYLTKKYLQKEQLRNFLRVVANSKGSFELKYFKISAADV
jgi:large subunit ribosomal protein L22e